MKRPILRYHGGKWMLAPWIISNFPPHRIYIEPFGGAASVLLRKERSYAEVYNDLDEEIVNVFRVVRDQGEILQKYLELTPFSRQSFLEAYEPSEDAVIRAARTVIKSFMGFGSDAIKNKSGFRANSNRAGTTPAHDWVNWPFYIPAFIERLKGVVIEKRPAIEIILQHDREDTLHYIDPPYVHSTRSAKKPKQYRYEMSDKDHHELGKVLHSVRGKVVISGYESPIYSKLYKNWRKKEKDSLADGARPRKEILWMNF